MSTNFEDVIKEFQKKRLEIEMNAAKIREDRFQTLQEMASLADSELKQRRRRRRKIS